MKRTATIPPTANKRTSIFLAIAAAICFLVPVTAFSQGFAYSYRGDLAQFPPEPGTVSLTFIVTNSNDSGAGSLRQAILNANANPGYDTIIFQTASQDSIANQTVEAGLASITDQTLVANSNNIIALTSGELWITDNVTIYGLGANLLTVRGDSHSRVFRIFRSYEDPVTAEINGMTITNGGDGSEVSWCGGGILSYFSHLYLNNVVITQNHAQYGGGICQLDGSLEMTNSTISDNEAVTQGGGLHFGYASTLLIINSTVSDNTAPAAGGISSIMGTLTIVNSTVSHNTATSAFAGGIENTGATINIGNTIVAANESPLFPDVSGVFNSYGNNLIAVAAGDEGFNDGTNGDQVGTIANPIDPRLGALQNNGGATTTHALLAGSPAINSGNNCVTSTCVEPPLTTDQRGTGFPRQVDGTVDIGAFEAADTDSDGLVNVNDNCPNNPNADQSDNDADGIGDVCDADDDNDTVADTTDNCSLTPNTNQANNDGDTLGDVCDPDDDNDGVADATDNCPLTANSDQLDTDGDGAGNTCDSDDDNDSVQDTSDNCSLTANSDQLDTDGDGAGNACDSDDDNDGVPDVGDNCPLVFNPNQADFDQDGVGDTCDAQTGPPRNKDQCKNDGWLRFDFPRRFKNQGDCIQFVNTGQ